MARRVADALHQAGADPVVAVGGEDDRLGSLGLPVIADDVPGGGPLPATITALRTASTPRVLVVSCDLLHPSAQGMRTVADALAAAPGDVLSAVPVVEGIHQWTHAAWRASAAAALADLHAAGITSLRRAGSRLVLREVPGLEPSMVRDADRPEDLPGRRDHPDSLPGMDIPEIDVEALAAARNADVVLIDVRQPHEFDTARVPGAHLIPLPEVPERIGEVPADADVVFVICASGGRSAKAVAHYRSQGVEAVNVAGGTLAWIDAGYPTEPAPGSGAGGA
jgi:rhodanese-related sulfurtransferase/molybdopterin-guanine dinucleotide biosynthesis protein A